MPRIPRSSLETSFFHIIVQGLNKEKIFNKEIYMKKYLQLINDNKKEYDIKVISYCIMNNHAHLLIYTDKTENMSNFMQKINSTYGNYYNFMENRVGYVFRNRFVSEPIYSEEYLLNCISYIHNNPVKAGIVEKCNEYRYSTYNDYIQNNIEEDILKLVFGSSKNYLEQINYVHKNEYKFKDYVKDNMEDFDKILREFENKNNKSIEEIKKDKKLLKKCLMEIRERSGLSYNKIRIKLNIGKHKMYTILE